MDRRVPFVADLPRGSHGRQPRAANSVSSIHFALLLPLCSALQSVTPCWLCKLQSCVPSHLPSMSCGRKARGGGLPGRGRYCGHRATLRLSSLREGQARWVGTQTNGFSQASPVFIELNEGFRRQGGGRKALHLPPI